MGQKYFSAEFLKSSLCYYMYEVSYKFCYICCLHCSFDRCIAAKGEDAPECDKFAKYYRALCPGEWV